MDAASPHAAVQARLLSAFRIYQGHRAFQKGCPLPQPPHESEGFVSMRGKHNQQGGLPDGKAHLSVQPRSCSLVPPGTCRWSRPAGNWLAPPDSYHSGMAMQLLCLPATGYITSRRRDKRRSHITGGRREVWGQGRGGGKVEEGDSRA